MASRTAPHASIEALESRIAPSVVIGAGGKVAHYTDLDGDRVTVTVSKGRLSAADFVMSSEGAAVPGGESLVMLDLSDDRGEFHRANITIVAKPGRLGGDGFADVGFINAGDGLTDLGRVFIDGDLGRIVAGDANDSPRSPGVRMLIAQEFGGSSDEIVGGIAKIVTGRVPTTGIVLDNVFSVGSTQTVSSGPVGASIVTSIVGSSAGLVKTGSGTLNFAGSNEHTGGVVTTNSGTLLLGGNSTFTGGQLASGGTLQIQTSNSVAVSTTVLSGAVTYLGSSRVISLGTGATSLAINDNTAAVTDNIVIPTSSAGGLNILTANNSSLRFATTSAGSLDTSAINYVHTTTLNSGTVIPGDLNANTLGNAVFTGSLGSANTLVLSGSGIIKTGTGSLILTNPTSLNLTGGQITPGGTMILNLSGGSVSLPSGTQLNVITGGTIVPRFSAQTIPAGAKITTDAGTITFGEGNAVATFTAPDGSASSIGGAILTINPGGSTDGLPNVASLELTGLDLGSAPTGSRKFEIEVGHNDAAIVQNRALFQTLLASGWIASAPVLGADGQITSIKLTKTSSLSFTAGN